MYSLLFQNKTASLVWFQYTKKLLYSSVSFQPVQRIGKTVDSLLCLFKGVDKPILSSKNCCTKYFYKLYKLI